MKTHIGTSFSSLTYYDSELFPIRINLELWILQSVVRIPWTGDQPCHKAATYTGQHKQRRNADRHSCLEWDSKYTIPVFERGKTFRALDRSVTVTDSFGYLTLINTKLKQFCRMASPEQTSFIQIDLKGFWRWCMLYRAIGLVLDPIHCLVCWRQNTTTFRRLDLSPSSGGWGRINLLSWAR
jgi:hypothetical protein